MPKKKAAPASSDGFQFVVSNGPKPPSDPAVRTMIRRQAMKDVGLERRTRNSRVRVSQTPSIGSSNKAHSVQRQDRGSDSKSMASSSEPEVDQVSPSTSSWDSWDLDGTEELLLPARQQQAVSWTLYAPFLSNDNAYEAAKSRFGVDLSMLELLTGFSVGKTTIGQLAEDPMRMYSLVSEPVPTDSFLSLVPQRYGSSKVVAAAVDCLLAKASSVLTPYATNELDLTKLYAIALRILQDAIVDCTSSTISEVLCAVQMMTLHELLDPSQMTAWSHHVSGSIRLMRYRAPASLDSEYERALFQCHVGPVVSEALHSNTHCYLAEPTWTALYESLIEPSEHLTQRHELVINARKLIFILPGLWYDIGEVMKSPAQIDDSRLASLEDDCRRLHTACHAWLDAYREHCLARSLAVPTEHEVSIRREILGQALESLLIVELLLASVCPCAIAVEFEIQALATRIMDLQGQPSPKNSWLFTGQEIGVAHVAMSTNGLFTEDLSAMPIEKKTARLRERYMTWSGALRGS